MDQWGSSALAEASTLCLVPAHPTNAGRDKVHIDNRLDVIELSLRTHDGREAATTMTPDDARAIADSLLEAADTGERTAPS